MIIEGELENVKVLLKICDTFKTVISLTKIKLNIMKPNITKSELKQRVNKEASEMKKQGVPLSLSECKKEAEKVFRDEFNII